MKFIITAGGQGTKVWPMSREDKPKQFQKIFGDQTLFDYQIETLLKGYSPKDIFISTKTKYIKYLKEYDSIIPKQNIIIEPDYKKNRGPGEGYAFLKLRHFYPNEPFMIIQSDVLRDPADKFLEMVKEAEQLAKKDRKLITAGQKAINPTLGVDYMRLGDRVKTNSKDIYVYEIEEFVERLDDYQKTKELVENFNVSTHANHLCWYPELILEAYEKYRPDWYQSLLKIEESFGKNNEIEITDEIYKEMDEGATEEVTKHIMNGEGYLFVTPFKWTDVGTWSSIYDDLSKFGKNYVDANIVAIDTKRSLIKGNSKKLIATLGIEDLIIVDTDDALLVTTKDRAGDIKQILKNLEESGREEYL